MKRFILISLIACVTATVSAQQSSPYVESGTVTINNSGFKSASIRTNSLSRPTPMHVHDGTVNATIPQRLVVAKADLLTTGTWAWANGWNTAANSAISGVTASVIPTGCAAYLETGSGGGGVGSWRVPTQREMNLIILCRFELAATSGFTQLGANRTYWTSTQNNATQAWAMTISASSMYPRDKTTTLYVRCVREKNNDD